MSGVQKTHVSTAVWQTGAFVPEAAPMTAARRDLSQDRPWLDGFRAGRSEALERVFRTYAPLVCAILRRGVSTASGHAPGVSRVYEQEDLLQEVFLRALSPDVRARYDGIRPYAAFIAGITRNVVLDHARKSGRARSRVESYATDEALDAALDTALDTWTPDQPLADDHALAHEERDAVSDFVAALDTEERRFVDVRFVEGLSQRDAAAALGTSRQRVRTAEDRLRERFRDFLKQRGL